MTCVPSSGEIRITDIATTFGGSVQHELTEYYRNGAYVDSSYSAVPNSVQYLFLVYNP